MDFSAPQRITDLLPTLRAFVEEEVQPLEPAFLSEPFSALLPALGRLRQRARDLGLWLPYLGAQWGGQGLSLTEFAFVSEWLGRSPLGHYVCNCQAPDIGNIELLIAHGSPAQQATFLGPLLRGDTRSCFSMTEPDYPGSNPTWMGATATREGDHYRLRGHKWFTSSAHGAAFAVVMALTDPDAPPHARASMFLVPLDAPGVRLVRAVPVMGHAGDDYWSHAEITYEDVRIPATDRLGPEGAGFKLAQARLGPGRIHHCMRWIGICERALALMCARATARRLRPDKPLADQQVVRHWIADSRAEIHAARLAVLHAAWRIERDGAQAARHEISMIKFVVAGTLQRVLDRAIQAHGALGLTDATPLAFWYAHERAARIYDGPDEVHRDAIAKATLQAYASSE
jgi:alkylation response protein AidB-like acyl-CoA dehydrogenase